MIRERPGLAPAALFHLIGNSVFLRLADVAAGLPPYEERVLLSSMDTEAGAAGLSQRSGYDELFGTLRAALADALSKGSRRLLSTYLQTLLAYPDGCTRGETVFDPETSDVLVQVPPLPEGKLYPEEQALVDLVAAERLQGRRVLVYATHWKRYSDLGAPGELVHGQEVQVLCGEGASHSTPLREPCAGHREVGREASVAGYVGGAIEHRKDSLERRGPPFGRRQHRRRRYGRVVQRVRREGPASADRQPGSVASRPGH